MLTQMPRSGPIPRLDASPAYMLLPDNSDMRTSTTQLYAQLADDVYEQEYQDFFAESHAKPDLIVTTRKRQPEFDSAYR